MAIDALNVLARDDGWLVVAKPPRVLVHRNAFARDVNAALQRTRRQVGKPAY